ncbi:MAG: acyl carrier protein [Calditrichales bacterium]|nr:acyl carrier protein [Calditrichales bacterium]
MDKIKQIIADTFKVDFADITAGSSPSNIEKWDSLGQLTLIQAIEKEFGVVFEIEENFEIMQVSDIYRILKRKGSL